MQQAAETGPPSGGFMGRAATFRTGVRVMRKLLVVAAVILGPGAAARSQPAEPKPPAVPAKELDAFRSRLLATTTRHLDRLLDPKTGAASLKGKSADGSTALAYYQMFELTGNPGYRTAAVALADRIVKDMRATKHGVLFIKEKGAGDEAIAGGGPPAFGHYTAAAAYILHREGGRNDDLRYIAGVIDRYPWNEEGWWANTVDIKTGVPKEPLAKAGAVNKSAAMALCAGVAGECVKAIDPPLAARLRAKAETCVYKQILPAQEADGFWHYGFRGGDPKNKDVLGYFMLTTELLAQLQYFTDSYRDRAFQSALDKAFAFAAKQIAPMTDPNPGKAAPGGRATAGSPAHYTLAEEPKRGFQLGVLLFAGKNHAEGIKVMDAALKHFPVGNAGADGAHAAHPSALILALLKREAK